MLGLFLQLNNIIINRFVLLLIQTLNFEPFVSNINLWCKGIFLSMYRQSLLLVLLYTEYNTHLAHRDQPNEIITPISDCSKFLIMTIQKVQMMLSTSSIPSLHQHYIRIPQIFRISFLNSNSLPVFYYLVLSTMINQWLCPYFRAIDTCLGARKDTRSR